MFPVICVGVVCESVSLCCLSLSLTKFPGFYTRCASAAFWCGWKRCTPPTHFRFSYTHSHTHTLSQVSVFMRIRTLDARAHSCSCFFVCFYARALACAPFICKSSEEIYADADPAVKRWCGRLLKNMKIKRKKGVLTN